ncbi:hypothetical protein PPGU19_052570 [Paraburkholderia sp. PGU19]|uniref:DUF3443 domain-containing protein n=1 Tax=Paraburkholderia sp. PGU19 TaxID=2735434 RepID=UPI0015DA8AE8|nr:DUF3443 domain-containing protein [Paraburkholderia sp. PGU19]BCG00689.1 hypothetical protein PPGU19_052570 [Paraburkholderia sp. PGU19]
MRALKWILAVSGMCVALVGCGGGGGSSNASTSSATGTSTPAAAVSTAFADPTAVPVSSGSANTVPIVVSSFSNVRNFPMVSVKVCAPNSGAALNCSTIDNVLVDTESFGLRLFASVIPTLNNLQQQMQGAQAVAECESFGSGNTWGTVRTADVSLSSEVAQNVPIQVIADPSLAATIPTGINGCLVGTNMTTPTALGANGILGIGTSPNDCGANCQNSLVAGAYYVCTGSSCTPAQVTIANQVTNPVTKFTTDNNGVIVEMAQVPDTGAATGTGTLVFGIDTQSNNALSGTNATILPTSIWGDMDAVFEGRSYSKTAFFDSGSSGLYFQSTALSKASNGFYTPAAPTGMSAVFTAANSATATVKFNVSNGVTLINSGNYAFNNLGVALFNSIDIGMPFFYGRHMYYGISGQPASSAGAGPYVAYVSS